MKKTNLLILLAVSVLSLLLVSGTLAAANASRSAVLLQNQVAGVDIARDVPFVGGFQADDLSVDSDDSGLLLIPEPDTAAQTGNPKDLQQVYTWEKVIYVNEVPYTWEEQIVIPVQTSDTVRIVDTVTFEEFDAYSIFELWNPEQLRYEGVEFDPSFSQVFTDTGIFEWMVNPEHPSVMVLTKWLHVEPCNWEETILTEEFYIGADRIESRPVTFQKIPPALAIDAAYDSEVTTGVPANFTLNYGNNGGNEVGVMIRNEFPPEAPFNTSDPLPEREDPSGDGAWVEWDIGELSTDEGGSITVTVDIQSGLPISTDIQVVDMIFDHLGVEADRVAIDLHVNESPEPIYELGDAPDSTNHFAPTTMTAYPRFGPPGTLANFPTVFDPATGLPQGPRHSGQDPVGVHLGLLVSAEYEADLPPDSDGITNLDVQIDSPDGDSWDDGVQLPVVLPHCVLTTFNYSVNIPDGQPRDYFVNVWFDWNRDGDWEDLFDCQEPGDAPEWAVQDQLIGSFPPGQYVFATTAFLPWNINNDPIWMRITLSEQPAPINDSTGLADGQGPPGGYEVGETEDYYLENTNPTWWEKYINGIPWEPGIEITVETSDTIEVVDVIHTLEPFVLDEVWDPLHLRLLETFSDPPIGGPADEGPGFVTWEFPADIAEVLTITKIFHVEECTWIDTALSEDLIIGEGQSESRFVIFLKRPPVLFINSTYDPEVYAGETATFTLDYGNNGGYENNVSIRNDFPDTAPFYSSDPPPTEEDPAGLWVVWNIGDLPNDEGGSISVTVGIDAGVQPSTTIEIVDIIYDHTGEEAGRTTIAFHAEEPPYDLGDAPDSSNHTTQNMTAYPRGGPPGTLAKYPTVFDPALGIPQGPLHQMPFAEGWLGRNVSLELEADLLPDQDGVPNIDPLFDSPDQDGFDDGVQLPILLPHCVPTDLTYIVTIPPGGMGLDWFVNVWFDWNRDGDWEDVLECPDGTQTPEWAVQDELFLPVGPDAYVLQTPAFLPYNPGNEPIWMRITLSEQPAPINTATKLADGRGPDTGYQFGETEDYYLENTNPYIWEKYINGIPWQPGIEISVETSDTIEVVDVIHTYESILLDEVWDPSNLDLMDTFSDPPTGGSVDEGPDYVTWEFPPDFSEVVTITKIFHVEECSWTETTLTEDLVIGGSQTESRFVRFLKRPPALFINSTYEPEVYAGEPATFTLDYGNNGGYENDVMIRNEFPANALFLSSDPSPTSEDPAGLWVEWDIGDLPNDEGGSIDVDVTIQPGVQPSSTIDIEDMIYDHLGVEADRTTITFHVNEPQEPEFDLGDAPDSSNHSIHTMTAYPLGGPAGVLAHYPTVFDPATGMPQGPLHLTPLAEAWLGPNVSLEVDADLLPDQDGIPNIDPLIDSPDQDGFDDGIQLPVFLPHCVYTDFTYTVTIPTGGMGLDWFVNVWFDWNRDGDWEDAFTCSVDDDAPEWAVQNDLFLPTAPGTYVRQTSSFLPNNLVNEPIWMRITLSEQPAPTDPVSGLADGRGPAQGYQYGETEDYYLQDTNPLIWEKYINGIPWEPGIEITVETSDTIEVVDVIHTLDHILLNETWNPEHLRLINTFIDPPDGGLADQEAGFVIWDVPPGPPEVITITKIFHVEECTWSDTTLNEELTLGEFQWEPRPILFTKYQPELWIDSFFDVSVQAGDTVSFTLEYSNTGGYENNVSIRNVFPENALFLASDPPPTSKDPGGTWVEWLVGDLASGDAGGIDVQVAIQAGTQPSTTIEIWDYIYNHLGEQVDETLISLHVEEPPPQVDSDIYIKDSPPDDGSVASSAPWWTSPDIWVRNDGDCTNPVHQNPVTGVPTTVCVRVRNRMATPVTNIDVDLYFASAALGLTWPVSWNPIGAVYIPAMAPLSEVVEAIPWNTPNLAGHFCLLARADALEDPVGSGFDTVAPADLVQNNNSIGMRNLNIVSFPEITHCDDLTDTLYSDDIPFDVINTVDAIVYVDIVFNSSDFPLSTGMIIVDPGVLEGLWTSLTNFVPLAGELGLTGFPASMNGVMLNPYEVAELIMSLSAPGNVAFEISVTEVKDSDIVGGINYLRLIPTCTYLPLVLQDYTPTPVSAGSYLPVRDIFINRAHLRGGLLE